MSYIQNEALKIIEQSPLAHKYTDIQTLIDNVNIDNTNINGEIETINYSTLGFFVNVTLNNSFGITLNIYTRTLSGGSNYVKESILLTYNSNTTTYIPIDVATANYIYFDIQADTLSAAPADITVKINKKYKL